MKYGGSGSELGDANNALISEEWFCHFFCVHNLATEAATTNNEEFRLPYAKTFFHRKTDPLLQIDISNGLKRYFYKLEKAKKNL